MANYDKIVVTLLLFCVIKFFPVCVKQVPGSSNVEVDPVTGVLKRSGVQSKINPYDLYAIETALSLSEKYGMEADIINIHSLVPLDYTKIIESVKKFIVSASIELEA